MRRSCPRALELEAALTGSMSRKELAQIHELLDRLPSGSIPPRRNNAQTKSPALGRAFRRSCDQKSGS
jgi:hypothetical protein